MEPRQTEDEHESNGEGKTKRIMVAIDESEESFYALKWVLCNLLVDQTVTLVHVQSPFYPAMYPPGPGTYYPVMESVRKAQSENSSLILSKASHICEKQKVKAESLIFEGDPKDMLCQACEHMDVEVLVVGCRGLGKIKRALLGSVSDYCAHHAKCPVLIVKPPKEIHH